MVTPNGVLYVSFYSDRFKEMGDFSSEVTSSQNRENSVSVSLRFPDPFGLDNGELRMARRIEANLIFTPAALERLIPWLQSKLQEMRQKEPSK